ncbi:hypothetical protein PR202_gb04593 [Eleusine coracana subsp. coracana]|uniref:ubiquitinyl hydrolase 1 n=1 Tax=Eleusine coracana subsp. coracana TaxID=191504 RepID=A0AAV5E532_ELECO|nr:hypothetical protein PR202_gb04593 [Eleusine coracana subsp. coracana]
MVVPHAPEQPQQDQDEEMLVPHQDVFEGPQPMEESTSTVDNQLVPDASTFRFTWSIENISKRPRKLYSDDFSVGGYKWRVLVFPRGNNADNLSMYLDVADANMLPPGWSRYAQFSLAVVNQLDKATHHFHARESDWGFTTFMPLMDLYDSSKGYIVDDKCIIEAEVAVRRIVDYWNYDSKKATGYVGLKNQGATCYMNSLLQTLYHIPFFRKHDVQELNRVLCEKLEDKMKGTTVEGAIQKLFEGHHMNYIECIHVDYKSTRKESFYDLALDVKGCSDVYASFDKYVEVERLEGDNKYQSEQHGLQDAKKGMLFIDFPPVLQLQLKRFEYDFARDTMVKINDRYEFPLQLDLDRDNGKYLSPEADRDVRNLYTLHRYKFDDERVTKEDMKRALEEQYGGEEELPHTNPGLNTTPLRFTKYSNAYMLVYIRESDKEKIICDLNEKDISEHLKTRLRKELEEKEYKKKEKAEAHMYTSLKVVRDSNLAEQIGRDVYFDLVDFEKINSFRAPKSMSINEVKQATGRRCGAAVAFFFFFFFFCVFFLSKGTVGTAKNGEVEGIGALGTCTTVWTSSAKHSGFFSSAAGTTITEMWLYDYMMLSCQEELVSRYGIPVQCQRFWLWAKRQNNTYRPSRPLTLEEETTAIGLLRDATVNRFQASSEVRLYLEVHYGQDAKPMVLPLPVRTKEDILLFLKLYNPEKEELRFFGKLFVKASEKPSDIVQRLNEIAGFPPDEDIELYEEVKFDPSVMCVPIDTDVSFQLNQVVCFRLLEKPKEDDFSMELSRRSTYDDVVEKVAHHLSVNDPSKIRLTPHNPQSHQPKPHYIKYRGLDHLSDMLRHHNQMCDILYYEILDIPLPELENMKTLRVAFHNATNNEVSFHLIRLPKSSTLFELIEDLKSRVAISCNDAEFRFFDVYLHKICKVYEPTEKIDSVNDLNGPLRIEERIEYFGEPFLFLIHDGEALSDIKVRIQKRLQVPDEQFLKWKFACVTLSRPEYLQDSDIVFSRFQKQKPVYGEWELHLGLEHTATTPKRSYLPSQNRHPFEKAVKIYN